MMRMNDMQVRRFGTLTMLGSFLGIGGWALPAEAGPPVSLRWTPQCENVWVPPIYAARARTVTFPAVHEDRVRKDWREPEYATREVLVEVPAEIVIERVPRYSRTGRFLGYDKIERIIRPARKVWKTERVLVRPGGWETVTERVCVSPERTEVVYENVLVAPGHWERVCDGRRYGVFDAQVRWSHERGNGGAVEVNWDRDW